MALETLLLLGKTQACGTLTRGDDAKQEGCGGEDGVLQIGLRVGVDGPSLVDGSAAGLMHIKHGHWRSAQRQPVTKTHATA